MRNLNIAALILFVLGVITLSSKSFTPEYIDSQGILHEWFFLIPIGFGIIFISLFIFLVSLIISIIKSFKLNNDESKLN
ncbi:DUF3955 domain-containing protein [Mammaliicoccus sciuri]|uniref:DUF3955 domain-containing protein n=1 Tax=Mammaliicoccus sciuri TaxID=1296 RepID=UPI002DB6EF45|nr:DUF3955 domain-containing protein [Mammaliicoccus sciuri]MEB8265326.1 DUF3955 domain-containing protein [Mammaliicoccus sciuri]